MFSTNCPYVYTVINTLSLKPASEQVSLSDGTHPLTAADIEPHLHVWLDTEFTFNKVEELATELEQLARSEQDFILDWIRRIASTHITLVWQFSRRAPALLPRMEQRLLEAWAVHTCDLFDRQGLQPALRNESS